MATVESWRKDTTKVCLLHVQSDYADLDVAIMKATNHVVCPPKERHIRKILVATSASRPRAEVAYCIHALARRMVRTRNWTVALKTLIVIHRILREGDTTSREELLFSSQKERILWLSNFKDDSSFIASDCSAWVRAYAVFLEERLEFFRILKYDIESERLPRPIQGEDKGYSRTRDLNSEELLEHLPAFQQLLFRLNGCRPEGAAAYTNYLIQYALALEFIERLQLTYKPEEFASPSEEEDNSPSDVHRPLPLDIVPVSDVAHPPPHPNNFDNGDLLVTGFNTMTPDAFAIEESNALALLLVSSDTAPFFNSGTAQVNFYDPAGWELALIITPSSNISSSNVTQMTGGLDSITLESLYDEGVYRAAQQPVYGTPAQNPFEVQDPLSLSTNIAPSKNVQMANMVQQQANPFGSHQPIYQQQQVMGASNPFGGSGFVAHPHSSNPYGSTGLL